MVFPKVEGPHYIKRTRFFINSNERIANESEDGWTFTIDLPEEIQNVFSLEVIQYNLPRDASPTFVGQYQIEDLLYGDTEPRKTSTNTRTLFRVDYPDEVGTPFWQVMSDMDPYETGASQTSPTANYVYPYELTEELVLVDAAVRAFFAGLFPTFANPYTIVKHNTLPGQGPLTDLTLQTTTGPLRYAQISYLYKTSGIKDNPGIVLGFNPNKDALTGSDNHFRGDYMRNSKPYRYMDVFVDEVPELQPLARLWLVDDQESFNISVDPPKKPRVLLNPVPRLRKMHIRLRLADGVRPPMIADTGVDLIFDAYSLCPVQEVPAWVMNTFLL